MENDNMLTDKRPLVVMYTGSGAGQSRYLIVRMQKQLAEMLC